MGVYKIYIWVCIYFLRVGLNYYKFLITISNFKFIYEVA